MLEGPRGAFRSTIRRASATTFRGCHQHASSTAAQVPTPAAAVHSQRGRERERSARVGLRRDAERTVHGHHAAPRHPHSHSHCTRAPADLTAGGLAPLVCWPGPERDNYHYLSPAFSQLLSLYKEYVSLKSTHTEYAYYPYITLNWSLLPSSLPIVHVLVRLYVSSIFNGFSFLFCSLLLSIWVFFLIVCTSDLTIFMFSLLAFQHASYSYSVLVLGEIILYLSISIMYRWDIVRVHTRTYVRVCTI